MTVHFVGAGPGAADLLTLRAARLLGEADVVVYPGTYLGEAPKNGENGENGADGADGEARVLDHCRDGAELVDSQGLDLDAITAVLVDPHRAGRTVVRLASGDPSVYSALTEQTRRLDAAGVPWSVTPGVASFAAAAAAVGRELTVPLVAQSVVITRPHARSTALPETERLVAFAATRATLALHLGITRTRELMAELAPSYGEDCPVAVVYRVSQPAEQVLLGTVGDIADRVEAAGLRQAAVILVGWALARGGQESWLYSSTRDRQG